MSFTATFPSAREAVRAEKACAAAGIAVAVVPPPKEFSSECGMALRVANDLRGQFVELMKINNINITIYG